jgi:antirestriction protein ArdC
MINAITGNPYTGNNAIQLEAAGFDDPRFLTFRQARTIGRTVRKGEHGITLVRVVKVDKKNAQGKIEKKNAPKYFTVFNYSQTEELVEA